MAKSKRNWLPSGNYEYFKRFLLPVPHSLPTYDSVSHSGQMTTTVRKTVSWLKTLCSFVLIKAYMREKIGHLCVAPESEVNFLKNIP